MLIESSMLEDGSRQVVLKGKWVSDQVIARVKHTETVKCFNARPTVEYTERGLLNNEAIISFDVNSRHSDIAEVVDYLNVIIRPTIGSALTSIAVNPYKCPLNDDTGSGDLIRMIAEDTKCDVDWGSWNTNITFKPESNTQYNKIVDLLNEFEMTFN